MRPLRWLAIAVLTIPAALAADSTHFVAAYVHPGDHGPVLTLFPPAGKETTLAAPPGLSDIGRAVYSSDGRTIYALASDGVWRNDLRPPQQTFVRGTSSLINAWHFTVSHPSGRIFVSSFMKTAGGSECGTYEIVPDSESPRKLLSGAFPGCGGGGGEVSPDGKRVLGHSGGDLALIDLETGTPEIIHGFKDISRQDAPWRGQATWSPDGKWVAVFRDGGVTVVDLKTFGLRKIGRASGLFGFSPDSTKLLVSKSQLSCLPTLYFESLALIDLQTGKEGIIKSSHCNISGGWVGWIDPEVVR